MPRRRFTRMAEIFGVVLVAVFASIQLIPYGRDHSNPPVVEEPRWDRPETRALTVRACFDCHSNETRWPWYSHVAPVSWLLQRDVDEGRRALDFSEWNRTYEEASDSAETVLNGEMPPLEYLVLHPSARLSVEEKHTLARGLTATLGGAREHEHHEQE